MLISIPVLLLALALAYYTSGFYGIAIAVLAVILFTGCLLYTSGGRSQPAGRFFCRYSEV